MRIFFRGYGRSRKGSIRRPAMGRCYVQKNGYQQTKGGAKMATPSKKNKGRTLRRAKYLILGSVMLTILIPQYVLAQEKYHHRDFYTTAKPGIYSPQTNDLEDFGTSRAMNNSLSNSVLWNTV